MAEIKIWAIVFIGGLIGVGLGMWNLFNDKDYMLGVVISILMIMGAIFLKNRDI